MVVKVVGPGGAGYDPTISVAGWQTALDLDLSAEPNQILNPDGNYPIAGKTWTKVNSADDRIAAAIVNGSGLVLQPLGVGDNYYLGTRTCCGLRVLLASIISNFAIDMPMRVWSHIGSDNQAAQWDSALMSIENGNTYCAMSKTYLPAGAGFRGLASVNATDKGDIEPINNPTDDVILLEFPNGLIGGRNVGFSGAYAGGWPLISVMNPQLSLVQWAGSAADPSYIGLASQWSIFLGAMRYLSATLLSVAFAHLKVEYKS